MVFGDANFLFEIHLFTVCQSIFGGTGKFNGKIGSKNPFRAKYQTQGQGFGLLFVVDHSI